jgi:Domain of unknown function (DUF4136)
MKTRSFLWLCLSVSAVIATLTLHSCTSANVATSIDSTIDFATYRTFAWLPDSSWKETKYDNDILQRNVEQEVVRILKAKGYVVDTLQADFLVHHHVTVEDRTRLVQAPSYRYAPSMGFMGRYGYYSMYQPMMVSNGFREVPYREGTLIVDVIDRKQQRLVWRGWSEQPLEGIAEFERSVGYRLQEILVKFPALSVSMGAVR